MPITNPFAGFLANWRDRRLRLFSVSGGAFCWAQFCVAAYTVVTCVEALGMNLIVAGTVLTVVQLCNAAGRMVAGWLADRLQNAARVLEWLVFAATYAFTRSYGIAFGSVGVPALLAIYCLATVQRKKSNLSDKG